jgi:hypothetical protein
MRQSLTLTAAVAAFALSACRPAEVVVTAEIEVEDPASGSMVNRSLQSLEVQLLPFDRDVVFDSMTQAASTPEPEIPAEILEAQNQIAQAQQEWRDAENRWNTLRDTLTKITTTLETFNRGEARYVALFRDFQTLEGQYNTAESRMNTAFARFDSLQKANIAAEQSVRIERENWAGEAYAGVGEAFRAKQLAAGLPMSVDTTEATGVGLFEVPPGQYWVHARYELPYTELYWNVPVTAVRGEPVQVQLTRANALERPKI